MLFPNLVHVWIVSELYVFEWVSYLQCMESLGSYYRLFIRSDTVAVISFSLPVAVG